MATQRSSQDLCDVLRRTHARIFDRDPGSLSRRSHLSPLRASRPTGFQGDHDCFSANGIHESFPRNRRRVPLLSTPIHKCRMKRPSNQTLITHSAQLAPGWSTGAPTGVRNLRQGCRQERHQFDDRWRNGGFRFATSRNGPEQLTKFDQPIPFLSSDFASVARHSQRQHDLRTEMKFSTL